VPWLNYHHLLYFWTVGKAGSVALAAEELKLSPSAVSAQVKELERSLGQRLLVREGGRLVPTDVGRIALRFADEIFRLGQEMQVVVREGSKERQVRLEVGIVDDFPPLVAERLLRPALTEVPGLRIVVRRGALEPLVACLATHECDVLLTAEPVSASMRGKAYDHPLGECGVTFFGSQRLESLADGFPDSLDGAPALLPAEPSPMRVALDGWFRAHRVQPAVVGEFTDQSILRAFAGGGFGFFAGASVVAEEIRRTVGVSVIGRTEEIQARFFAVTVERKLVHPGVAAIVAAAKRSLPE
jgi:LysR family transcriptional activator of nhaA